MSTADLEAELARELRALQREFISAVSDDDALRAAIADVRAARARLGSEPRSRWFESIGEGGRPGTELNFNEYSLYRGRANPLAVPMRAALITRPDGTRAVEGFVTCSRLYEGPPHGVHGGYVAGLFDDVLGGTIRLVDGPSAVTGTLSVRYRKITPLETELRFTAWIHHESGRRIHAKATCHAGELLTAEADAMFVRVDMRALAAQETDYRPSR